MIQWLIVGAGAAGRVHCAAIKRINDAAVAGVVTSRASPAPDIPSFADLGTALERTRPDAIVVATPNDTHLAIVEQSLDAGLPVLCEKPVGASTDEAKSILSRSESSQVPVGVVLNQRFSPQNIWIRELIASGRFDLSAASCVLALPRLSGWQADPVRSGGLLRLIGIHYIDLLRWWLGRPERLSAIVDDGGRANLAALLGKFPGGRVGQLLITAVADTRRAGARWVLEGRNGRIETSGDQVVQADGFEDIPKGGAHHADQWFGPGHAALLAASTRNLMLKKDFPVPLRNALPSLELVDEIYAAANSPKPRR